MNVKFRYTLVHKESNVSAFQKYKFLRFVSSSLGQVINMAYSVGSGFGKLLPIKPFGNAGGLSFFGRIVNNLRFIGAL